MSQSNINEVVVGWRTKKVEDGFEWEVYTIEYQKKEEILDSGKGKTRAIAMSQAKKSKMYYKKKLNETTSNVTQDLSSIVREVMDELQTQVINEVNEVANMSGVFDAIDMKIEKPSLPAVSKFLEQVGCKASTAKRLAAGYMAYKSGKVSKDKAVAMVSEITAITRKQFTSKDIKNWKELPANVQSIFNKSDSTEFVGSQEMIGHIGRKAIFSALAYVDGNKAIIKGIGWNVDGKKGQWSQGMNEAYSIGDNVFIKKNAKVVDRKLIGKLGMLTSVGKELTVHFPTGQTIVVTKNEIEPAPGNLGEAAVLNEASVPAYFKKQMSELNSLLKGWSVKFKAGVKGDDFVMAEPPDDAGDYLTITIQDSWEYSSNNNPKTFKYKLSVHNAKEREIFNKRDLSWENLKTLVKKHATNNVSETTDAEVEDEVDEMTTNANVQGYNTPGAFSGNAKSAKKKEANLTKIAHGTFAMSINEMQRIIDTINDKLNSITTESSKMAESVSEVRKSCSCGCGTCDEAKRLDEALRAVKVTFSNGDTISTSMAAGLSDDEIRDYYKVGKSFNIGNAGRDKMAKVKKVEILNEAGKMSKLVWKYEPATGGSTWDVWRTFTDTKDEYIIANAQSEFRIYYSGANTLGQKLIGKAKNIDQSKDKVNTHYKKMNEGVLNEAKRLDEAKISRKELEHGKYASAHANAQHFSRIDGKEYTWNYLLVKNGSYEVTDDPKKATSISITRFAGRPQKTAKIISEGMDLAQIKKAVDSGKIVHWSNKGYKVVKDKRGNYDIVHTNGNTIGLTHKDGKTLNGEPKEFFLNESINENIYGSDGYEKWASAIQKGIKAPYVNSQYSTLGGEERASVMFTVGLDPKETWNHNILQNSRYGKFALSSDGTLELHSADWRRVAKFRKSKVKSVADVISKVHKWIASAPSEK